MPIVLTNENSAHAWPMLGSARGAEKSAHAGVFAALYHRDRNPQAPVPAAEVVIDDSTVQTVDQSDALISADSDAENGGDTLDAVLLQVDQSTVKKQNIAHIPAHFLAEGWTQAIVGPDRVARAETSTKMGQTASGVDPLVSESPVESDPDSDLHDVDRSVEVAGNEARAKPEAVSTATVQSQQNGVWRVFSNAPAEVFATSKAAMSIAGKTDQVLVQAKKSDVASGEMPPLPVERGLFQSGGEKIVEKPHPILAALQDGGGTKSPKGAAAFILQEAPRGQLLRTEAHLPHEAVVSQGNPVRAVGTSGVSTQATTPLNVMAEMSDTAATDRPALNDSQPRSEGRFDAESRATMTAQDLAKLAQRPAHERAVEKRDDIKQAALPSETKRDTAESPPIGANAAGSNKAYVAAPPVTQVATAVPFAQKDVHASVTPDGISQVDALVEQAAAERHIVQSTSMTGQGAKVPPTAQVASAIGHQMAVEVTNLKAGSTEIALSPEELGKVTLTMKTIEGSVTVLISAERPETQDLMRRHIEALGQEFRSLGFTDINFSFQDQGPSGQGDAGPGDLRPDVVAQAETAEPLRERSDTDGLDLRL